MSPTDLPAEDRTAPGHSAPMSRARYWSAVVLSLVGIAILANLGLWQIDRLYWKQAIVETINTRIHAEPISVAEAVRMAAETGDVEYVPVEAKGRFLHGGERFFFTTFEGDTGWNVHTPLLLEGGREAVFVNRGFVPYAMKAPAERAEGQTGGDVVVTGLARNVSPEKPASFVPDNDVSGNVFYYRNLDEMAEGLGLPEGVRLLPFVIDAGRGAAAGGYPVGGTTVIDVPNNHLQYAITWFSLAAIMVAMLVILIVSQSRRRA